jgi:translation initiation factor 1
LSHAWLSSVLALAVRWPRVTTKPPSHHPFAKLQALRTPEPSRPDKGTPQPPPAAAQKPAVSVKSPAVAARKPVVAPSRSPAEPPAVDGPKGPAWAVVRFERKGRAGKEATVVEKLALPPAELERWCKELKQALGCGGVIEGDTIVLQGDLRTRLFVLLTKRGVRRVTVS